jgi:hypothetical protein
MSTTRIGIPSPQRWQRARGLRLKWAFIRPTLATRSGVAPYNPMLATLGGYAYMLTLAFTPLALGVNNTLGAFASHWLFIRPGVGNTLGGCASNSGIGNTLGGCASH